MATMIAGGVGEPNPFNIIHLTERDNPKWRLRLGRQTVRNAYRHVGVGNWKKRMPSCHERDRVQCSTRKCADVQMVLNVREFGESTKT